MCKKEERYRQYEKLMKQKKPEEKPANCKKCLYHQPEFQFRCKSQYLNVQKTENKNVHYPLFFKLTFQKSLLFLQAI